MKGSRRNKGKQKVVCFFDLENLIKNLPITSSPEKYSLEDGFDRLIKEIAQEMGDIVNVYVFVPPHLAMIWGETLHRLNFFTIFCPKIRSKDGQSEEDTVDQTLIEFGKTIIQDHNLTHICLGSGDKDFSGLLRLAIRSGKKIIIVSGDISSLSSELIKLADTRPNNEKAVFSLSPT